MSTEAIITYSIMTIIALLGIIMLFTRTARTKHPLPNDPNLLLKQVYEDMQATEPLSDNQRKVFQKWRKKVRDNGVDC